MRISSKNCNEKSDGGFFLKVDVQYTKKLHELQDDFPFLFERMKIEKVICLEYVIHIRNLKQVTNHGLLLMKMHRIIKFNEKTRLKSYIEMNIDLVKKAKNHI